MAGWVICAVCGGAFYGRIGAVYCSSACRQKAHRARTARRIAAAPAAEVSGAMIDPVPVGDAWMSGRFGNAHSPAYLPPAEATDDIDTGAMRIPQARDAEAEGARVIRRYVDMVGRIAYRAHAGEGAPEFDTPLGNSLPSSIEPAEAARLADTLRLARPRVNELLRLLQRRGYEGGCPPVPPTCAEAP